MNWPEQWHHRLPWMLLGVAIIAFYLPWLWHPSAGLSPGGYDLAEWISLHPAVRQASPPLWPSFFLRAEMSILAIMTALYATQLDTQTSRWIVRIVAILLALTLFPPLEFFTIARNDTNYHQQFALGITSLVFVVATVWSYKVSRKMAGVLIIGLNLLGIGFGVLGLFKGRELMTALGINYSIGLGIILLVAALGFLAMHTAYRMIAQESKT